MSTDNRSTLVADPAARPSPAVQRFTAAELTLSPGRPVEHLPGGAVRVLPGAEGVVLSGPHISVAGGVYRVTAELSASESAAEHAHWDVYAKGLVRASTPVGARRFVIVRLDAAHDLEFLFLNSGAEFELRSVALEPLLLDDEAAEPEHLRKLLELLISEQAEPTAFHHVAQRLSRFGHREFVEEARTRFVRGGGRLFAQIRAAHRAINTPNWARHQDIPIVEASEQTVQACLSLQPLAEFDLYPGLRPPERKALLERGYQPDFLYATLHAVSPGQPQRAAHRRLGHQLSFASPSTESYVLQRLFEVDLSFQTAMAQGDAMVAFCPISGRRLASRHGVLVRAYQQPFLFYRFEGVEVFYICVGGWVGGRQFIYMPATGTLVRLEDPMFRPTYALNPLVAKLGATLVLLSRELHGYLRSETRPAAVVGFPNLGHYFWSDLGGLKFAAASGLARRLHAVVPGAQEFLPPESVVPELRAIPRHEGLPSIEAARRCFMEKLLPIRFTDVQISDDLAEAVLRAASERVADHRKPPADTPRPLIWINLRAHNKVWTNQAAGYAEILNALCEEHGSVSALLDGWSDCRELAEAIRAKTSPNVRLFDGLEFDLFESLYWAYACDAYIATVGSGLVLLTWLANKPGVAHAEHAHLTQLEFWNGVRNGATAPLAPSPQDVVEIGSGMYCNYELDWRLLLDLLRRALARSPGPSEIAGC